MVPALSCIHHVELWVNDVDDTAQWWCERLGFKPIAVAEPADHALGCESQVLAQGTMYLVVTGPSSDRRSMPVAAHVDRHGDGVRDVCFAADSERDVEIAARSVGVPMIRSESSDGVVCVAEVPAYGDTLHSLWYGGEYDGPWAPGYVRVDGGLRQDVEVGITELDHANAVVGIGETMRWVTFYENVLGFQQTQRFDPGDLASEDSAVMSRVIGDGSGRIKLPLTEPSPLRPGHVGTFLDSFGSAGIQHLALATDDIVASIEVLQDRGIEFMTTRPRYYEYRRELIEQLDLNIRDLSRLGILVDADDEGSLLQVFTMPVVDRPTLFLELIERRGCTGFGAANIRWLAKSAERAIGASEGAVGAGL